MDMHPPDASPAMAASHAELYQVDASSAVHVPALGQFPAEQMVRPASAAATGLFGPISTMHPIGTAASASLPLQRPYRCRVCGELKKGHVCKGPYNAPAVPELAVADGIEFQEQTGERMAVEDGARPPLQGDALPPPRYKCGYCGLPKRGHVCPFAQKRKSAPLQRYDMQMPPRPACPDGDGDGDADGPMVAFVLSLPPAPQETVVAEAQRALARLARHSELFEAFANSADSDDDTEADESDGDGEQDEEPPPLPIATAVATVADVEEQHVEEVEAENVELLPLNPAVSAGQPWHWMASSRGGEDDHSKRGRCGLCGGTFVLTKDGTMRKHKCVARNADGSIRAGPSIGSRSEQLGSQAPMDPLGSKRSSTSREDQVAVGDEAKPRKRSSFSGGQLARLVEEYEKNELPTRECKEALSEELGLPPRSVFVWFQNRRQRYAIPTDTDMSRAAHTAHEIETSINWRPVPDPAWGGMDERAEAAAAVMQLALSHRTQIDGELAPSAAAEVGDETPALVWSIPASRFVLEPANASAQADERTTRGTGDRSFALIGST